MYEIGATLAIGAEARAGRKARRFERFLSGNSGPRPICDEPILEVADCLVVPTLGSILPYWLLIVPRQPVSNFAEWQSITGNEPTQVIKGVLSRLGVETDKAIWFEHGASQVGSLVGCGVDHAHLHVLIDTPISFAQLAQAARDFSDVAWSQLAATECYKSIKRDTSYLLAGFQESVILAQSVETVGSQFFRRIVAELVGQPHAWNYITHPHLENVTQTLVRFGHLPT